nr:hypothetical protein BaRGS_007789 [Batillaria attramentaria]
MLGFPTLGLPVLSSDRFQTNPNMLTCIGADAQDPTSQIRLTITPLEDSPMNPLNFGLGLGPQQPGMIDRAQGRRWKVSGLMLPSQVIQKPRTGFGGMGHLGGFGGMGGFVNPALGMMSPFGMGALGPFGSMNPFLQNQQAGSQMGGSMGPTALTQGPTVYSAILSDVSYDQLVGGSVGVCQAIQGGVCMGAIPYCCSITKDALPADQVYVDPNQAAVGGVPGVAAGFTLNQAPGVGSNFVGGGALNPGLGGSAVVISDDFGGNLL